MVKLSTLVSSVTPSPLAPKSTTLKTAPCEAGGGSGGRDGCWWPFPQFGVGGLGLGCLLLLAGLGLGLTGASGVGLGWYGFWFPLPAPGLGVALTGGFGLGRLLPCCRWELLFFPLPFFSCEEPGELLGLQCLPLLASLTSMVEQRARKTRRSRRPRPFALSFILLSVSIGCVDCEGWIVYVLGK